MNRLLILTALLAGSSLSFAGSVSDAKVTQLYCGYFSTSSVCSVVFDKDFSPEDSCITGAGYSKLKRMQFKLDDEIGKALLSIALTSYTTGATVNASSIGTTCTDGFADLKYIELKK